jgi:hypothetical protein
MNFARLLARSGHSCLHAWRDGQGGRRGRLHTFTLIDQPIPVSAVISSRLALGFERWTKRVDQAVDDSAAASTELEAVMRSRAPMYALTGMIVLTLLIVFVMVVKPTS